MVTRGDKGWPGVSRGVSAALAPSLGLGHLQVPLQLQAAMPKLGRADSLRSRPHRAAGFGQLGFINNPSLNCSLAGAQGTDNSAWDGGAGWERSEEPLQAPTAAPCAPHGLDAFLAWPQPQ